MIFLIMFLIFEFEDNILLYSLFSKMHSFIFSSSLEIAASALKIIESYIDIILGSSLSVLYPAAFSAFFFCFSISVSDFVIIFLLLAIFSLYILSFSLSSLKKSVIIKSSVPSNSDFSALCMIMSYMMPSTFSLQIPVSPHFCKKSIEEQ